ncbi:MAG: Fis family transcriptional regulator [Betaproteobacteria bacterium HGW-Betaproteobacteria-7]|jgi:transcriptional regulator with PAS, ATPase and Fis domain|nr:MAG: Fis family transcriptional regulator [Betaproteobacteria bacterium HGW-Betaproteobacteria-7]
MSTEQQSLSELISFLESLPEPHILCDRSYRIIAANDAYRQNWLGTTDIVGRKCYEVSHRYTVPCDQAGESCPLQRSLRSGQRERVLHLHHTPHGESFENIELSPVRDAAGEIAYYIEKLEPLPGARSREHAQGLIGRSPPFMRMLEMVARVAPSAAAVLLQGESGTGKELVASAIHQMSRRADGPFVAVDCSGLAETLFESELFGHERGAFTGAVARKVGLIEAAAGGTLFLDEVGDIPLSIQVKLLRLLETGTFRRVGSPELRKAEVRIVSATHRPLNDMVADGRFRQDLFYRLNIFPIHLPPLRQRGDDVLLLADSLLARVAARPLTLSGEAVDWLARYPFPGNVRELRNMLERACLLCDGDEIRLSHLPVDAGEAAVFTGLLRQQPPATGDGRWLAELLGHFAGNRKALAAHLGLSERTLYRRLQALKARQPASG